MEFFKFCSSQILQYFTEPLETFHDGSQPSRRKITAAYVTPSPIELPQVAFVVCSVLMRYFK
ncbi:hypothetical protein Hanom_Chr07g00642951 [Helianthus anomalus]